MIRAIIDHTPAIAPAMANASSMHVIRLAIARKANGEWWCG